MDSLRASIGLVMEDSFLFSESVKANIAYGRPDATDEQVIAAAKQAEAHEFIMELPRGYDTVIGEQGLTLSGGQRQRVSLARALITDPRVLLLDDATSAVDARVEAEIHATLHRVMASRTTLLIAHRRSTLELADRIAVLDGGRLVDVGTAAELEARCPLYRLLLAGPGDDAEGIDAGEVEVDAPIVDAQVDGVTPALWDESKAPADLVGSDGSPLPSVSAAGLGGGGRVAGGGRVSASGGPMTTALASMPATPELLAAVDKLPPITDVPNVDERAAAAPDPHFTLKKLLRPLLRPLLFAFVLVALDAVATLAIPLLIRTGVNEGVSKHAVHVIWLVSVIALVIVFIDWAINWQQTRVTMRTGERFLYTLRLKTFAHLQRLGLDYYEKEMSGRIMTRMTTDVDAFSTFLQTGLTTTAVSLLTFVGILVALLYLNLQLGLVIVAVLPIMIVATLIFRSKSSKAYTEAREKVSIVNADLQENVAGMRVAQAYRREQHNAERFAGRSDAYRVSRMRAQRYIATYFPFVQLLSDVASAVVLIVGASLVNNNALTAGALIAYLLYIDMFFAPIQQLSQVFDGYQQAMVGLARIRDLLRTPTSTPQAARPVTVPEGAHLRGEIVFDDVHFRYGPDTDEALRGVTLRVPAGETLALVGQTGAGKSTVVKLVSRFYDVTGGAVRVDDVDVRRVRHGVVPASDGRRAAGGVPVPRHRTGHHRVRPPGRDERAGRGGRPRGRCARDDRAPRRRLLPRDHRPRPEHVGRSTTAPRTRSGAARRPGHPDHGRGDGGARPRERGSGRPGVGRAGRSPYHSGRGAPPDDGRASRPDRRARRRSGRRGRHARRTVGGGRALRIPVGGVLGRADERGRQRVGQRGRNVARGRATRRRCETGFPALGYGQIIPLTTTYVRRSADPGPAGGCRRRPRRPECSRAFATSSCAATSSTSPSRSSSVSRSTASSRNSPMTSSSR